MKKRVLFAKVLILSVAMNMTGLAWSQGTVFKPAPTPTVPQSPPVAQPLPTSPSISLPPLPPPPKKVFVTSTTYTGNIWALGGADGQCQLLARQAGLSGTYLAWISYDIPSENRTIGPGLRFQHSSVPYILVNGTPVANNWNSLIAEPLKAPICLTEKGQQVEFNLQSSYVWTGTMITAGVIHSYKGCANWSTENECFTGVVGDIYSYLNSGWAGLGIPWGTQPQPRDASTARAPFYNDSRIYYLVGNCCNARLRLYCFEQ